MQKYAANDAVKFGVVVLSGGGPRGGPTASPGAGGWPTIRYYNKETGVDGQSYQKKTSMAMCSELGPENPSGLDDYIVEAGGIVTCSILPPNEGCSEREVKFIETVRAWDGDKLAAQSERLGKMKGTLAPHLEEWLAQRLKILKQFAAAPAEHSEL